MADLSIVIRALDQASSTIGGVTGELDRMDSRTSRLGGLLKGGLALGAGAAVAGIGALGAVLATSVDAASEAEDIQAQLNAVLASTGGAAGVTADAINDHALALSKVTKFEDDAIVASGSLMLTFTKVGADIFPRATDATLDMAQAMKMDLNSATMLVGKALNDPIKGMTALSRSGIQFTEEQKGMVEAMVETGDMAGAQAMILNELETQFGGSAEAAGKTLSGSLEILKNQFGNVKEEIGGALLPVLTKVATAVGPVLVGAFEKFGTFLSGTITVLSRVGGAFATVFQGIFRDGWNVGDVVGFLSEKFPALAGVFSRLGEAGGVVTGLLGTVRQTLVDVGTAIAGQVTPVIETLVGIWNNSLRPAFEVLGQRLQESLFPALQQLWTWLGTVLPPVIETVGRFFREQVLPVLGDVAAFIVAEVLPAIFDLVAWLAEHIPPAIETVARFFRTQLLPPIRTVANWLSENIPVALETLKQAWIDAQPTIEIIKGIFSDIGAVLGTVWSWMQEKIPAAVESVKKAFEDAKSAIEDVMTKVRSTIDTIVEAISRLKEFFSLGGGKSEGAAASGASRSAAVPPAGGYRVTLPTGNTRGAAAGVQFNIVINAPGGNPQAVAAAAQTGVLAAARSVGLI